MPESRLIYWDSCAFIHLLQQTEEYFGALDDMKTRARNKEFKIVTSAVSIAEVCKIPETGMLPSEQSKKILAFFENEYVQLWQADRAVCENAHTLIQFHELFPMDAIHIATALMAKVEMVITTDSRKYRRKGLLHLDGKIGNPTMQIKKPEMSLFLPIFTPVKKDDTETTK
jgi:predicted nucleic acid-binding protein